MANVIKRPFHVFFFFFYKGQLVNNSINNAGESTLKRGKVPSIKGDTLKVSEDIASHTFAWWGEQTCPHLTPPPPPHTNICKIRWLSRSHVRLGIVTNKGILFSHVDRFLQTGPSQKLKKTVGLFYETTCLKSAWTPPKEEEVSEMGNPNLQFSNHLPIPRNLFTKTPPSLSILIA